MTIRSAVALLVLLAAGAVPARAAEPLRPSRVATPPVIDGVLDDEVWQGAARVDAFKTWRPDYGQDPAGRTIAYAAYDAENMYFAFRAYDREPARIKASMASRDSIRPDDWICLNLDSFDDQQALYSFYVNPLGIQMDSRFAANKEDIGFDAVWYSAGRIDAEGYTIEMRLPFKSIRYSGGSVVTMGVIFERSVSRLSEGSTFPALDPRSGFNFNIQTLPMVFQEIKHYTLLEVLPDATYSRQHQAREGRLAQTSAGGEFGVTAKYGLTPQLTVDATYNPDFSQVEADAGQIDVNLRHPLFFAEKRPFFLEGNDVFNLGGPSQAGVLQAAVHTRTIVNPVAGLKVSGKVSRSDTLAVLYAVDETGEATDAQVSVVRYKRALNQDAYLGGFYVGREQGALFGRLAGVDGMLRLDQSSSIGFHAFASESRASADASAAGGHAVGVDFSRDTRRLTVYAAALDVSKAFDAAGGYLTRNGVAALIGQAAWKFYPRSPIARRVQITGFSQQTRDAFAGAWETSNGASAGVTLPRSSSANMSCRLATEIYETSEFATSGCTLTAGTQVRKQLRLSLSANRGQAIYYSQTPSGGWSTQGTLTLVYQPSEQWYQSLGLTYANFDQAGNGPRLYDYAIVRSKTTFQLNKYLLLRAIAEYKSYRHQLLTDFLGSFTYIPGTVLHAGYGSLYEKTRWDGAGYVPDRNLLETRRGLFLKASYLWRL
jgi:hypothetical protein